MAFDDQLFKTSSKATGTTLTYQKIAGSVAGHPDLTITMYDTAGLSESTTGSVSSKDAFKQLVKLLYELSEGVNLLICCVRKGKFSTESFESNYKIFVNTICESKIPCLLVITHSDVHDEDSEDDDLDVWWTKNKEHFETKLKFNFDEVIPVTTRKNNKYMPEQQEEYYKLSRKRLLDAIKTYSLEEPYRFDVLHVLSSYWQRFLEFIKKLVSSKKLQASSAPLPLPPVVSEEDLVLAFVNMFKEIHCSDEDATKEAKQLLEEIKQIQSRKKTVT
jgi:hypothetical protein